MIVNFMYWQTLLTAGTLLPFVLIFRLTQPYSSCCVDEVAAQHVDADALVHYGHACMSLYVSILLTSRFIC
jgi:Putative diphthamide synthesis protein